MSKKLTRTLVLAALFATATTQISAIGVGGWIGYNLGTGVDLSACEALKGSSGECSKGGIALGGDLWLFGIPAMPIKFGVGAAYIPITNQKYTSTVSTVSTTTEFKTTFIPVYAEARADFMGFFGGVTIGYGIAVASASSSVTSGTTTVSGTASAASSEFGIGGFAGYGIGLGPVSIEGGVRLFAIGSASNLMPFIGAKFEL